MVKIVSKEFDTGATDSTFEPPNTGASVASVASLLGADLVVVALAWDNPPSEGGIVTITFLMMISFVAFINVLHQTMRIEYIYPNLKNTEMKEELLRELGQIGKWTRIFHVMGFLFTMIAFWLISYKYLISLSGYHIGILSLPFILFILYWMPKVIGIEREVSFLSRESLVQLIIQILFLALICLDFLKIITIY